MKLGKGQAGAERACIVMKKGATPWGRSIWGNPGLQAARGSERDVEGVT